MEENNNIYVSSRGILKSCDYYSYTPISSIMHILNYPNLETIKTIKNPSIYICSSAILNFMNEVLPLIDFSFILVSGDCDETVPQEILSTDDFNKLLNNAQLVHWFCQNMTVQHNKITKMPIGLDYHTLTVNPLWGPLCCCQEQEKQLIFLKNKAVPFWNRNINCYANFHFSMHTKLGYDRKDAYKNINKDLIYYEETPVTRLTTWNKQVNFAFVICPHGGGLDCHRNWEALCLGCIPIVKTSPIDSLYNGLPVLIVDDWQNITINLLDHTIIKFKTMFKNNEFNMEKIRLEYWTNLINSYK
jgi:hypothetical protein